MTMGLDDLDIDQLVDQLYARCVESAVVAGGGIRRWLVMGARQRRAYVAESVLATLDLQDGRPSTTQASSAGLRAGLRNRMLTDPSLDCDWPGIE